MVGRRQEHQSTALSGHQRHHGQPHPRPHTDSRREGAHEALHELYSETKALSARGRAVPISDPGHGRVPGASAGKVHGKAGMLGTIGVALVIDSEGRAGYVATEDSCRGWV